MPPVFNPSQMRNLGREIPNQGYIHTDRKHAKNRIGEPNADEIFYADRLAAKKDARRQRKKEARQEKARGAKSRAAESVARELRSEEARQGLASLFADGQMDINAWLERYYRVVETGGTSSTFYSEERLQDFTRGAVVSDRVARDVEYFLGPKVKLFDRQREERKPADFDIIAEKLELTREEAIKLVALVSFQSSYSTLQSLFEHRGDSNWNFLNDRVSEEEFSVLQKLFRDSSFTEELLAELARQNAGLIEKHMSVEAMDSLVMGYLKFNHYLDQPECQALFATESVRERYRSLFTREKAAALQYAGSYEFLFGEFSAAEFLELFPDWPAAESWHYSGYKWRFGLSIPGKQPEEVSVGQEPVGGEDGQAQDDVSVQVVPERRILELLEQREETGVAKYKLAHTGSADEKNRGYGLQTRESGRQDTHIYTPYERNPRAHIEAIRSARERLEREAGLRERLRIFFADVWPQLLIARADEVATGEVVDEVEQAIQLLGEAGALADRLSALAKLSADKSANVRAIERLAAELRSDETLERNGVYTHTEVIYRQREKDSQTSIARLLSGVSFAIDETHTFAVDGRTTKVHALGRRLDRLNQDVPALGFTYTGDNHGVVLKGAIREHVNAELVPYLNDDTEYLVGRGEKVHPLTGNIRAALRRDFPANPTADELSEIYAARYKETRDHEQRHKEDELRGVQARMGGAEKRVAQETTAYLAGIAGRSEDAEANCPFASLVAVIELYIDRATNAFAGLGDPLKIYGRATERILLLLAQKLSATGLDPGILAKDPVGGSNAVLQAALNLDRESLRDLATAVLQEETARQTGAYQLTPLAPKEAPAGIVGAEGGRKPPAAAEDATTVAPEDHLYVEAGAPPPFAASRESWRIDPKSVRKNLRAAAFSATLIAALFALRGDSARPGEAAAAADDGGAAKARRAPEDPARAGRYGFATSADLDQEPGIAPAHVGTHVETISPEPGPSEKERKSFQRGVWGYAEQRLREKGLHPQKGRADTQKIARLTDMFLRALEKKGMVSRGRGGIEWHVPVYGQGIDRIIAVLRAEVPEEEIDSLARTPDSGSARP